MNLRVYTDGARVGTGKGGWAWVLVRQHEGFIEVMDADSGYEDATTNQRMEVKAVIEALKAAQLKRWPQPLVIVSDSAYVVNCFLQGWWKGWLMRDWVNSQRKPVANRDLWEQLIALVSGHRDVTWEWVKGHSGVPGNEEADRLASQAARS